MAKRKKNKKPKDLQNSSVENPVQSSDDTQNLIVENVSEARYCDFVSKIESSPESLIENACKFLTSKTIKLNPDYNEICRKTWISVCGNKIMHTDPIKVVHMIWDQATQMESSEILSQPLKLNIPFFAGYNLKTELLHYAITKNHYDLVKEFLASSELKNAVLAKPLDHRGVTPIETALRTNYDKEKPADMLKRENMLKLLQENGIDINMRDIHKQGSLFKAVLGRKLDIVKLLLKLGARDIVNKEGLSGEDCTAESWLQDKHGIEYPRILKAIQNHKAQLSLKDSTTSLMIKSHKDAVKQSSELSKELSLMIGPDDTSDFHLDFYSAGDIYTSENITEDVYLLGGAARQTDQS